VIAAPESMVTRGVATGTALVVVPALDAAATIASVVAGVRQALPDAPVLVVDDGSTDATGTVARRAGARVLRFDVNRGKGAALRAAFALAVSEGASAVLTIDADGQHDPAVAPALLETLTHADVVIGVRPREGTPMPFHRRVSNGLSSWAISCCAGVPLPDTQSGYRAIRAEVLRSVAPEGDRYEFETDFLIRAARAGFRIAGVPIPTIYGAPSHFRPLHDAARVVATIWRHRREAFR
jgi:glycosyltransferase involved in cell wall biosynthesis